MPSRSTAIRRVAVEDRPALPPCSTGCGRPAAARKSERCELCTAILARRTTYGTRGVGVVAAAPREERPAELPSMVEPAPVRDAAWRKGEERIRGLVAAPHVGDRDIKPHKMVPASPEPASGVAFTATKPTTQTGEVADGEPRETVWKGRAAQARQGGETPTASPTPQRARPGTVASGDISHRCRRCNEPTLAPSNRSGFCIRCRTELVGHHGDIEAAFAREIAARNAPPIPTAPATAPQPEAEDTTMPANCTAPIAPACTEPGTHEELCKRHWNQRYYDTKTAGGKWRPRPLGRANGKTAVASAPRPVATTPRVAQPPPTTALAEVPDEALLAELGRRLGAATSTKARLLAALEAA